jgi:hypothetical protein
VPVTRVAEAALSTGVTTNNANTQPSRERLLLERVLALLEERDSPRAEQTAARP